MIRDLGPYVPKQAYALNAPVLATLSEAGLIPFQVARWLAGLAPDRLAVPLEDLRTFFLKGVGKPQEDDK